MKKDYTQLRSLLEENEVFPIRYLHKIIGKNTAGFRTSVGNLCEKFPALVLEAKRESSGGAHASYTFAFEAATVGEVIALLEATENLGDLVMVL